MSCKKSNNACTLVTNCFCAHSSVILVFTSLLRISGNKHQNNTLVSAETVRHSSTYIILYQADIATGTASYLPEVTPNRIVANVMIRYICNASFTGTDHVKILQTYQRHMSYPVV